MNDRDNRRARYPLRAVIRRTGLSADVIRAWERRYRAVTPQRSGGGQRLYTEDDVTRLALLRRASADGHSIGEIARLDTGALEALIGGARRRGAEGPREALDTALAEALAATERFDTVGLEQALKRAALSLGIERFVDEVVSRFLYAVGDHWRAGTLCPAHEHLASTTMRRVLAWVSDAYEPPADAPRVVIATPSGELHELGAMAAAAAAAAEGVAVVYLGASLSASDIATAVRAVNAKLVALSVVHANGDATTREVIDTARMVPAEVGVVVGGAASSQIEPVAGEAGVRVLRDLVAFRHLLRTLDAGSAAVGSRESA